MGGIITCFVVVISGDDSRLCVFHNNLLLNFDIETHVTIIHLQQNYKTLNLRLLALNVRTNAQVSERFNINNICSVLDIL